MKEFLEESSIVDYSHPSIQKLAKELSSELQEDLQIAKICFEYVRDKIHHTADYNDTILTCKASDVLKYKTGLCYAKSNLLTALLRANNIPTGFCYQRLHYSKENPKYCLHGLNAIYLEDYGWYKVDARGNKEGIDAQFTPPIESLAFQLEQDETSLDEILPEPLKIVTETLQKYKTFQEIKDNLPDMKFL